MHVIYITIYKITTIYIKLQLYKNITIYIYSEQHKYLEKVSEDTYK